MGFFNRNKAETIESNFKTWLYEKPEVSWVGRYIDEAGNLLETRAFNELTSEDMRVPESDYTVPQLKQLLAELYAEFLGVEPPALSPEDEDLLAILQALPLTTTIRRVKPKASGNHWSVQYARRKRYYGKTLKGTIEEMFRLNPDIQKRLHAGEMDKVSSND